MYDIVPCLIAKLILQKYFEENDSLNSALCGSNVNVYLRDTTLIDNMDLSYEIFLVGIESTKLIHFYYKLMNYFVVHLV